MSNIVRRSFLKFSLFATAGLFFSLVPKVMAKTYMSGVQARHSIWGDLQMIHHPIDLTKAQVKAISKASDIRVNSSKINGWKSKEGDWFLLEQVIGKHENIDIAVGIDRFGKIKGIEILEYRETYGHQVAHPKWLAQFIGKDKSEHLKLDKQIRNISGATLSCRHITDGVNRLVHTWDIILKNQ